MNQENEITASSTETQVKSISERKRFANRQNARLSTGPRTEAGKRRSRWNAIKHGLLVKDVPANHWPYFYDDLGSFQLLMEDLVDHFDPVGPVEGMLVERIGQCYWRSHRFQLVENATIRLDLVRESLPKLDGFQGIKDTGSRLDLMGESLPRSDPETNDGIEEILRDTQRARYAQHLAPCNLLRYETANQRQLYGALHELERLQGLRRGDNVAPKRRFST
jgi:hypothetical protein